MDLVCLDMESVLVPEMWIEFAKGTGNEALTRTTRDEPDYDKLMQFRINYLRERDVKLRDLVQFFEDLEPLEGAREFLDKLRRITQVIIVSDTFPEFATPLMEKLGWPTLFANGLEIDEQGYICGYRMRCENSKLDTVQALQSIGFETIAAGDSYNDIDMIRVSKAGFLFHASEQVKADYPDVAAYDEYDELFEAIRRALS